MWDCGIYIVFSGRPLPDHIQYTLPAIVDGMNTVMAVPHYKYYHPDANFRATANWRVKFPIPRNFKQTEAQLVAHKINV